MTLIATPGAANANSYITVAEADSYFATRPFSDDWTALVTADKEAMLITSTSRLDVYDYVGIVVSATQALKWPRQLDDTGASIRTYDGEGQIETATIVGTVTGDGDATVIVTAASMTGSPITLNVPVLTGDTASVVATKIRSALNGNATIAAFFSVGGTGAAITLTAITAAANDSTMNLSYTNGTCTGLTPGLTSADTRFGSVKMIPPPIKKATCETALNLASSGGTTAVAAGTVDTVKVGELSVKYATGAAAAVDTSVDYSGLTIDASRYLAGLRLPAVIG